MEDGAALRDHNRKLLEKLKKSQEQISRLIITSKHSDHRVLSTGPLTSTVVDQENALTSSEQLLAHAGKSITKSPGILKKKGKYNTHSLRSKHCTIHGINENKPPKYPIISRFLKEKQKDEGNSANAASCNKLLSDPGNERPYKAPDSTKKPKRVVMLPDEANPDSSPAHVKFQCETSPEHATGKVARPLLGYDFIAGVLDNNEDDSPAADLSDSFLNEMVQFRKSNRADCHSRQQWNEMMRTPKTPQNSAVEGHQLRNTFAKSPDPSDILDPRIVNFTINKRLFPVAVDPNFQPQPGTSKSPRYVRVSIPKSSLSSPYRFGAKRRDASAAGTDSLALPDHCVMGWQHTIKSQRSVPEQTLTCLDLRSSLRPRSEVANLQLKAGQMSISRGCNEDSMMRSAASHRLIDESHSMQFEHQMLQAKRL